MKILATSDLHGHLPEIPECDILIIGGDICPTNSHDLNHQLRYLARIFVPWLDEVPAKRIIGIAGNHDFIFEHYSHVEKLHLNWTYLCDESVTIDGLKFYGLPWVPNLPNWAFHLDKEGLALRYDGVPKDTDIVISHGPPWKYGDFTSPKYGSMHTGPKSAVNMINRVRPHAFICGHIHEGFGLYTHRPQHGNSTNIYNVAYVDEHYEPRDQIVEIHMDGYVKSDNAVQDSTDKLSEVCGTDTSDRQAQEPVEGSGSSVLAVA